MRRFSSIAFTMLFVSASPVAAVDFDLEVRPILSDACFPCHGPDEGTRKAKLRLDVRDGLFSVRDGRRIVAPSDLASSELIRRVKAKGSGDVMPPADAGRQLTDAEIETLEQWVKEGGVWQDHWAYRTPVKAELPAVRQRAWPRNAIDHFVLAKLESSGLAPSLEASAETLIRRVTLDLTGLPPTLREVDDFLADSRPDAYERLVDRLLDSPRYGERMVWEWLAASRYADTNGYQGDQTRRMWPWRDWVIEAFNQNKPFDVFSVEQIAGDLLPNPSLDQRIATGFNRNHMINGEGGRIAEENRVEYVFDQTETVSTIWLGLTVGCARCHDHKYDAITQKEYYQLFAYFNNTPVSGGGGSGETAPAIRFAPPLSRAELTRLEGELATRSKLCADIEATRAATKETKPLPKDLQGLLSRKPRDRSGKDLDRLVGAVKESAPDYAKALQEIKSTQDRLNGLQRSFPRVMVMEERKNRRKTFLLNRGSYDQRGYEVSAKLPAAIPAPDGLAGNRLGLAKWLLDDSHPLVSRVTVNRYWQQFFGVGLVKTVDDFGVQGEKPSHPKLLDWLSREFIDTGWDFKRFVRFLLTSATYRQ
ncbi:MAG: PSD1 and planctomycete cytochrome C domain-containing protein, partial [Planctomycetota bacterium]